jgi:hypothetical protein
MEGLACVLEDLRRWNAENHSQDHDQTEVRRQGLPVPRQVAVVPHQWLPSPLQDELVEGLDRVQQEMWWRHPDQDSTGGDTAQEWRPQVPCLVWTTRLQQAELSRELQALGLVVMGQVLKDVW